MEIRVTDLRWSWDGDFSVYNGDLADTSASPLLSLVQEVQTRIKSALGDWKMQPNLGANLFELKGEPNSRETAHEGMTRIITALTKDSFLPQSAIKVTFIPVDIDSILYKIQIFVNAISNQPVITLGALVDFDSDMLSFV